jgi:hypothetical protein
MSTGFHIGIHVDFRDIKSGVVKHFANGNHIRVNHTPGKRFHGHINKSAPALATSSIEATEKPGP